MTSMLPVAGFAIIDAPTLDAAIRLIPTVPFVVAHGVVEIWPPEAAT